MRATVTRRTPKIRRRWLLIPLLLACLGTAASAEAAQRYAEPAGDGPAATCPQSDPCDLDTAVENAAVVDGDEVIVTPGTYTVSDLAVTDAIDLHGQASQPRPTINTSNPVFPSGIVIDDAATVRDLSVNAAGFAAVSAHTDGALIERVTATTNLGGATTCVTSASVTLRDSICTATGNNTSAVGMNLSTSSDETIQLRNVTAVGFDYGVSFGLDGSSTTLVDARNVIADKTNPAGGHDVRALAGTGGTVRIDLSHSNYATVLESTGGGGVETTVTDPGTGTNQTAAPVFAGPSDYRQDPTSPTVDGGAVDPLVGSGDFEGDPRVAEGDGSCPTVPDIGADELVLPAIDCDPPETSITSGPSGTTSDPTPTFALAADEPNSSFECRIDSAAFASCSTPFTTEPLTDGVHTLQVQATDQNLNVDPTPASRTFTVDAIPDEPPADTDPPETTITSAPKAKVKTRKKRVRAGFTFSSDEPGSFECALDGDAFAPCSSPLSLKVGKGAHELAVRAVDAAGNADGSPDTAKFKVKRKKRQRR